jgi:hypothetical protein
MTSVGFETTNPTSARLKADHAVDRAATGIGRRYDQLSELVVPYDKAEVTEDRLF